MTTTTNYFKVIRKITASFASLFSNITLIRYNENGSENQKIKVALDFGDSEKYFKRLTGDPELDKKIQVVLPRISYQSAGFRYDSSRKLNTNNQNFYIDENDNIFSQYNPVPYDFDYIVTIYTRNIEDGNQILENILPYFCPDYSMTLNLIPEMGIVKVVPVLLNSINQYIQSDGLFDTETRIVMWSLSFTVKGFIFGAIKSYGNNGDGSLRGIITKQQYNISGLPVNGIDVFNKIFSLKEGGFGKYRKDELVYQGLNLDNSYFSAKVYSWDNTGNLTLSTGNGDYIQDEFVFQGTSLATANTRAEVQTWDNVNKILYIKNQIGRFVSNNNIIGATSNTSYILSSNVPTKLLQLYNIIGNPHINQPLIGFDSNATYLIDEEIRDYANTGSLLITLNPENARSNSNWTMNVTHKGYMSDELNLEEIDLNTEIDTTDLIDDLL